MLIIPSNKSTALEEALAKLEKTSSKKKTNVVKKTIESADITVEDTSTNVAVADDDVVFTPEEFHELDVAISTLRDLLREYRQPIIQNLAAIKEDLYDKLDNVKHPYAWATTVYSAESLIQYDELTRAHLKLILREYFDAKGNYYEGWKK